MLEDYTRYFKALMGRGPECGSTFSGCGGADTGLVDAGLRPIFFCEIDEKVKSVLRHNHPGVPIESDISTFDAMKHDEPDVLWCSPPCQAFSISGNRESMDDYRGNLSLVCAKKMDEIDAETTFIENVPGWLSTKDNAFGCFIGYIAGYGAPIPSPTGRSWPNAGVVLGPRRKIAYRIVDSQGFVPQRRRRVLVCAVRIGSRIDPVRLLFESEEEAIRGVTEGCWAGVFAVGQSLHGDTPQSGEKGEEVTSDAGEGTERHSGDTPQPNAVVGTLAGSGAGMDRASGQCNEDTFLVVDETYAPRCVPALRASGARTARVIAGNNDDADYLVAEGPITCQETGQGWWNETPVGATIRCPGGGSQFDNVVVETSSGSEPHCLTTSNQRLDYETETFVSEVSLCIRAGGNTTGGGRPPGTDVDTCDSLIATYGMTTEQTPKYNEYCGGGQPQAATYGIVDDETAAAAAAELLPTMSIASKSGGGSPPATAYSFAENQREEFAPTTTHTLRAGGSDASEDGTGRGTPLYAIKKALRWIVRRLTPVECERLQGWGDNHTQFGTLPNGKRVEFKNGPRYKMIGNGVTGDVSHWLAYRWCREWYCIWLEEEAANQKAA